MLFFLPGGALQKAVLCKELATEALGAPAPNPAHFYPHHPRFGSLSGTPVAKLHLSPAVPPEGKCSQAGLWSFISPPCQQSRSGRGINDFLVIPLQRSVYSRLGLILPHPLPFISSWLTPWGDGDALTITCLSAVWILTIVRITVTGAKGPAYLFLQGNLFTEQARDRIKIITGPIAP